MIYRIISSALKIETKVVLMAAAVCLYGWTTTFVGSVETLTE